MVLAVIPLAVASSPMRMPPSYALTFQCTGRSTVGARSSNWEDSGMRITVLTVPDCPNAPVVRERITAALAGRVAQVELVEVTEEAEAARWGMTGSPTVLLDGGDPFAAAGAVPSVSCRLYRDEDGRIEGAPSVAALRRALAGAEVPGADAGVECCEADVLDPIGRAGRGRRAPAERGLREVHQAVLRH